MYFNKSEQNLNEYNSNIAGTKLSGKEIEPLKPIQHPKLFNSEEKVDNAIISHRVPPKNLTPYFRIPDDALAPLDIPCKDSPAGARSLTACLLGAPNAGKSSLIN